ncbi:MAG: AmmeMemoRadiSam system radical SAM enzyme [Acidobacteriota bacterium]|nr:MAG: AmmeMemoRadiSam system radical SAM enzyme [Acidobacteriota bacterium]
MGSPFVREALLQTPTPGGVVCGTCERRCVIAEMKRGWCRTRQNRHGVLDSLIYGAVSSLSRNPIEKKPLFHFYPGSFAATAGSWSCNFDCSWCQNFGISKQPPAGGRYLSPRAFVALARRWNCQGTSISLNEPTLSLEWSLEVFRLAREIGLYNTFVTNGYMTEAALDMLTEAGLDALNADVKGDAGSVRRLCGVDVEVVWRNCRRAIESGLWLEITTLVIPGVNDERSCLEQIARRIAAELGRETPWHVSRYFPAYRFEAPSTSVSILERARNAGQEAGLRYVYLANVQGGAGERTDCPQCGAALISRAALRLEYCHVTSEGCCPHCTRTIPGAGWGWARRDRAPA